MGTDFSPAIDTTGADAERMQRAEISRNTLDASGTVWYTHKNANGAPSCHGLPCPGGAPLISECVVRVEAVTEEGERVILRHPDGREMCFDPCTAFADGPTTEDTLFRLAGGRSYKATLRHKGDTLRYSALYFDLRSRGDAAPIPGPKPVTDAPPASKPAATPAPAPASEALLLGQSPVAALLGSAIPALDPVARMLCAFAFREAELERRHGEERLAVHERAASTYVGLARESMRAATGGGASDFYAAELARERSRNDALNARVEQLSASVQNMQVDAARGAPPASPAMALFGQYVMPAVAQAVVGAIGPEGVAKAVGAVASAAAPAVAAAVTA